MLTVVTLPAAAQSAGPTAPAGTASHLAPIGRPAAERKIGVDLTVSTIYDSNALRASAAQAAAAGLSRDDISIAPALALDIALPFGRNVLTLGGTAGYNFYLRNDQRSSERIGLNGSLSSDLRRCATSIDAAYSRYRSDFANVAIVGAPAALTDNMETVVDLGGQISCGGTVGFRPTGGINYSRGRNSQALRTQSDYDTLSYEAGLVYAQPSIGEIGLLGTISRNEYPQRPAGSSAVGRRSFVTRSIGLAFERQIARPLQARIRLNYTDVDTGTSGSAFSGLSGEAAIRLVPGGQAQINARIARTVGASLQINTDYSVATVASFGIDLPVGPKLGFALGYDFRHNRYYGQPVSFIRRVEEEDIHLATASARYKINRRLGVDLGASYESRRANDSYFDYDAIKLLASLRLGL